MKDGRTIRLSSRQLRYLADARYLSEGLRGTFGPCCSPTEASASFEIAVSSAEQFRSAFTERLAEVGFDDRYELTEEGRLLEDLLDAFMG